jgi:hypothetical protein
MKPPDFRVVSPQVQEERGWLTVYSLCQPRQAVCDEP